jgi:hypothetical protein
VADRPTLWLTNATSRRAPFRGHGMVLTIMAAPRAEYGEAGVGAVRMLVPPLEWVRAAKAGTMPIEEYRARYLARFEGIVDELAPECLMAVDYDRQRFPVWSGDTLVCACSRAAAAEGRCHRTWAAGLLLQAGWRVILDGRELS